MNSPNKIDGKPEIVVEKFRVFRNLFDKYYIISAGGLWLLAFLWDIIKLQRYWFDYMTELYFSFFIFFMILFSLNPKFVPIKIYELFSIITTIKGRGAILLIIAFVFLGDPHAFHKLCAVIFLIGGIIYFLCEVLVPTTKEELGNIEKMYNEEEIEKKNLEKNEQKNSGFEGFSYGLAFSRGQNKKRKNNDDDDDEDDKKDEEKENEEQNNDIKIEVNEEKHENKGDNKLPSLEDKIKVQEDKKKTDNPYDIPEDF